MFDGVSDCSKFFPRDVTQSVRNVPETAGLVVGVVVQDGSPSVVAGVGVEIGGLGGLVDGPAVVLGGNLAPSLEVAP
jgi:hypothetical protein